MSKQRPDCLRELEAVINEKETTYMMIFVKYMKNIDPDLYQEAKDCMAELLSQLNTEQISKLITEIKND